MDERLRILTAWVDQATKQRDDARVKYDTVVTTREKKKELLIVADAADAKLDLITALLEHNQTTLLQHEQSGEDAGSVPSDVESVGAPKKKLTKKERIAIEREALIEASKVACHSNNADPLEIIQTYDGPMTDTIQLLSAELEQASNFEPKLGC